MSYTRNSNAYHEPTRADCDMLAQIPSSHGQNKQPAFDIKHLERTLHKDFQNVDSRLRASKVHYDDLNARFVAADAEHTRVSRLMTDKLSDESRMSSLMAAKLLAEADGQELYARRLRESVTRIEQQHLNGGSDLLRLTDTPAVAQHEHEGDGAFELDAGLAIAQMINGSDASENTIHADADSQQMRSAPAEQKSPGLRASTIGNGQTRQMETAERHSNEIGPWQPHAIAQLTPLETTASNTETFSWEELVRYLGGNQYSPGLYFSHNDSSSRVLPGRTYWLLESHYEPYAPKIPGQHGAKLTAFFNDSPTAKGDALEEADYADVPVFVCLGQEEGYTYMGQYSQKRYSDKLSHSELCQHIPTHVLEYWANQLADPHRPDWLTEQLVAHFWPQPPYAGPMPSDSAVTTPLTGVTVPNDPERVLEKRVLRALERYALELRDWKKDAQFKAKLLNEHALMEMWNKSDMDEEKGLRLWWEYLECIGFEEDFYGKLVGLKKVKQLGVTTTAAKEVQGATDLSTYSGEVVGLQGKKDRKQRHDSLTPTGTSTPKETALVRSARPANIAIPGAFPQADLQEAREFHDKTTKASDRKGGRSDKPQPVPTHARGIKW